MVAPGASCRRSGLGSIYDGASWRRLRDLRAPLLFFLDIPEYRGRRGEDTADILAGSDRLIVLAEIDVGDHLALAHLHGFGNLLLLGQIGGAREIIAQLLDPGVARPAECGLVAARIHEAVHYRIEDVGRDPGGQHAMPATGVGGVLLDAAADDALPVARLHVDLEA